MSQRLTLKQAKFIANIASGMSGTKSVMDAYGISNVNIAAVIASENLRKLKIQQALKTGLEKHNISLDSAIRPIGLGLKAKIVVGDKEFDDLDTQLKASDRALQLLQSIYK